MKIFKQRLLIVIFVISLWNENLPAQVVPNNLPTTKIMTLEKFVLGFENEKKVGGLMDKYYCLLDHKEPNLHNTGGQRFEANTRDHATKQALEWFENIKKKKLNRKSIFCYVIQKINGDEGQEGDECGEYKEIATIHNQYRPNDFDSLRTEYLKKITDCKEMMEDELRMLTREVKRKNLEQKNCEETSRYVRRTLTDCGEQRQKILSRVVFSGIRMSWEQLNIDENQYEEGDCKEYVKMINSHSKKYLEDGVITYRKFDDSSRFQEMDSHYVRGFRNMNKKITLDDYRYEVYEDSGLKTTMIQFKSSIAEFDRRCKKLASL